MLFRSDPIAITATDSGFLKEIKPNGQKAVIISFMGEDYLIDLQYNYKYLQSVMEKHKKAMDADYDKKMKTVSSADRKRVV